MRARGKTGRKRVSKRTQVRPQRLSVRILTEQYLRYEDLKDKDESEIVLVNSNWLKALVPIASRCKDENKRREVLLQLYKALDRLKGERDVYVPMKVCEVRICAGNLKKLPVNVLKQPNSNDYSQLLKKTEKRIVQKMSQPT